MLGGVQNTGTWQSSWQTDRHFAKT